MTRNIFSSIPAAFQNELAEAISGNRDVRIERIVSRGHKSQPGDWYDQDRDEFVLLLSGEAKLTFHEGDSSIHMRAGDYITIPAHKKHRVDWTDPDADTVWLAVHY